MTAQELASELRENGGIRPKIRMAAAAMLEGKFVSKRYDPKRCDDKVEALTEQLACEVKRGKSLLCTLDKQAEQIAQAALANAQLVQTIMELRAQAKGEVK
jgi:acetylglutamate kinase